MLEIANSFRKKKMPADDIVSDINYMNDYKVFTWSKAFPDVKAMMGKMNERGFDMVTIVNPGIKV